MDIFYTAASNQALALSKATLGEHTEDLCCSLGTYKCFLFSCCKIMDFFHFKQCKTYTYKREHTNIHNIILAQTHLLTSPAPISLSATWPQTALFCFPRTFNVYKYVSDDCINSQFQVDPLALYSQATAVDLRGLDRLMQYDENYTQPAIQNAEGSCLQKFLVCRG